VIRWMFTHIDVSRSLHCAINNLTGDCASRARPDACRPPAYAVWLSARVPCLTAVGCGPKSNRECGFSVLLALQRVPDRTSLSHWKPRRTARPRWSAHRRRTDEHLDALAHTLPGHYPQSCPACLWLVPHALELCHARSDTPGHTRHRGVSGNRTPLALRDGRGVETRQADSQR
jgi:hypothetical protein